MKTTKFISCVLLLCVGAGCIQKYNPPVRQTASSYLVIEGTINSGQGPATLLLSRATNLDSMITQHESGAQVTVQADDSTSYGLQEVAPGQYTTNDLNLNSEKKYRLKIHTSAGGNYVSDFVAVVPNPPIDSINYREVNGDLQISVNTHNPQNNTKYYQWQYKETWEFHSAYYTTLKYIIQQTSQGNRYSLTPSVVAFYPPDPTDTSIYRCWQSDSSTRILIGSTINLSADVINLPIATIDAGSFKLSVLYSIDILQYGWSQQGYQFLSTMQKNTEGTGSIFNPQPSQLLSNIHCTSNPAETVIGYFNVSQVQEKRFFISASDVPDWNYQRSCPIFIIPNDPDSIAKYGSAYLPTTPAATKPIPFSTAKEIVTFNASLPLCVDCTLSGTNARPAFWP